MSIRDIRFESDELCLDDCTESAYSDEYDTDFLDYLEPQESQDG